MKDNHNKEFYSFANIDNYLITPFLPRIFMFNLTVVQMGPGLVYVFLKNRFFSVAFVQYIQTVGRYDQILYHKMFCSKWIPYWLSSAMLYGEAIQVYNDMIVWDSKKFQRKAYLKDNEADTFIEKWRTWFSRNYKGCHVQLRDETNSLDW